MSPFPVLSNDSFIFSERSSSSFMIMWRKLNLHNVPIDMQILSHSSRIALKGDVTIYDAIPVALADLTRVGCVTADRDTQYAKLRSKGYPICLL